MFIVQFGSQHFIFDFQNKCIQAYFIMGGKSSKKRNVVSTTRQSAGAPAVAPLASGGQSQPEQSAEPERVDSNTRGDYTESSVAASSSKQAGPKEVVEASNPREVAAVTTATEKKTPCKPHDSEELGLAFREIYVQYIPGKPLALTHFGALLYSCQDGHEFRALDGTGLARTVGLRNHDVLLSINNLRAGVTNVNPLAIHKCLTDVGTNIGLMVERNREEIWLFAFHLDEEGNRPVVKHLFQHRFDIDVKEFCFPLVVIPTEASFEEKSVYEFDYSQRVQIILQEDDRFMKICTDKVMFVESSHILTLNYYKNIYHVEDDVTPVVISTSTTPSDIDADSEIEPDIQCDDYEPMCIQGVGEGPLKIATCPKGMTKPGTKIARTDEFFFMKRTKKTKTLIKAANTQQDLYITSLPDGENPDAWIGNLGIQNTEFRVVIL